MKRLKNSLHWCMFNIPFVACLYYGYFREQIWCKNLAMFYLWLSFALTMLISMFLLSKTFSDEIKKRLQGTGKSIPGWIDVTTDVLIVCFFASKGMYVTAICWFIQILATSSIRTVRNSVN